MNSKILIVSHKKLTTLLHDVLCQFPTYQSKFVVRDIGFGGMETFLTQKLPEISPTIMITGGAHLEMLQKSNYTLDIPTIPIPLTRYDLLSAVVKAKTVSSKIAIIHYGQQLNGLEEALTDFSAHIQFFQYKSNKDAFKVCEYVKRKGFGVVVGAGFICEVCESFQLPNIFLHSEESVRSVIEHVIKIEEAKTQILNIANQWSLELMKKPISLQEPPEEVLREKKLPFKNMETLSRMILEDSQHLTKENSEYFVICKFKLLKNVPLKEWAIKAKEKGMAMAFYTTENYVYSLIRSDQKDFSKVIQLYMYALKKCGISHRQQLFQMHTSNIEEALQEAELAYDLAKKGEIESLSEKNAYSLLLKLYKADALPTIKLLKPLLQQRNAERLIETLEILLDHGLSITTVSNILGISRQTVYSAMKKIELLVGLLSDVDNRFLLLFELKVYRLKQAFEKQTLSEVTKKIDM